MSLSLLSPVRIQQRLGQACRRNRKSRGWSLEKLSQRSGVSTATIKRFEATGAISTDRLVALLISLELADAVLAGFESTESWSLEQIERAQSA
jgi:transcriptional regulator with XRE-family HTH domain